MGIGVDTVDSLRIEERGAPFHTVHEVSFGQKNARQISAVLASDTGNQSCRHFLDPRSSERVAVKVFRE
jgi:hypothetical protein